MSVIKWYYCPTCNKWFGTLGLSTDKSHHLDCNSVITACASGSKPAKLKEVNRHANY